MSNSIMKLFEIAESCSLMNATQEDGEDQNSWISPIALGVIGALGAVYYFSNRTGVTEIDAQKPNASPFDALPDELMLNIFKHFTGKELAKIAPTSKKFELLVKDYDLWKASELKCRFPLLKNIFDKEAWGRIVNLNTLDGVSFEGAGPFNPVSAFKALKDIHRLKVEGDAGYTIITMPQGMTINKLKSIIARLAAEGKFPGNAQQRDPGFDYFDNRISKELGDMPVNESYTFVISNSVLSECRNIPYLIQRYRVIGAGCELPQLLEAMTLIFLTYMASGVLLCGEAPLTYMDCLERIDDSSTAIGGSSYAGLCVYRLFGDGCLGAGGARKFF